MTATAGRSSRSSLARPGSAEPWWATLRISIRGRREPRGDVGLRVGRQERVDLAVASRAARRRDCSDPASGAPGPVRPEHAEPEPAEPEGIAGSGLDDRDAARRQRPRARRPRTGRRRRAAGSSTRSTPMRAEHRLRAADVVALRVREDERRQPADAEVSELLRDLRLGRPLVDEDRALRNLEQDRVALTDVEERDPEAGRRRQLRPRAELPDEQRRHDRRGAGERRGRRQRGSRCRAGARAASRGGRRPPSPEPICANGSPPTSRAHGGDVGGEPAVQPRERERRRRQQRLRAASRRARGRAAGRSRASRARSRAASRPARCRTAATGSARSPRHRRSRPRARRAARSVSG